MAAKMLRGFHTSSPKSKNSSFYEGRGAITQWNVSPATQKN